MILLFIPPEGAVIAGLPLPAMWCKPALPVQAFVTDKRIYQSIKRSEREGRKPAFQHGPTLEPVLVPRPGVLYAFPHYKVRGIAG
jgi:hypothetical protein